MFKDGILFGRVGTAASNKLKSISAELKKCDEVFDFMERRAQEGDVTAEEWVTSIEREANKLSKIPTALGDIAAGARWSGIIFTEQSRQIVNAAVQRKFNVENYISEVDWQNRTFNLPNREDEELFCV